MIRGRDGEAYNVGIDRPEISMKDLAGRVVQTARELFDYRGKVVTGESTESDYLVDNPNRRCPDMTKSNTELGYHPTILVDEGLRRALTWYHYHREAEDA
jgi:nucleoside-diphosphate-sugar epimerase